MNPTEMKIIDLQNALDRAKQAAVAPTPTPAPVTLQTLLITAMKEALTPERLAFYPEHLSFGAPGIIPFIKSERFKTLIQLIDGEYRDFLATGS